MEQHIKIIGTLHTILGGMGVLGAVALLVLFNGLAGFFAATGQPPNTRVLVPFLGGLGGVLFVVLLLFSAPSVVGGIALLKHAPWSRIFMIVVSALYLFHLPVGTALGVYGLWALTKPEAEAILR